MVTRLLVTRPFGDLIQKHNLVNSLQLLIQYTLTQTKTMMLVQVSKLKVKLVNTVLRVSVTADCDVSDAAHNHRRRHCPMSERVVQSALSTAGYALTVATYTAVDNTAV